ncbi:hypothetical protein E3E14_07385 [Streptomyces sp. ICN441]|nr:hypothetical protein E3E14_07385 [Streptomyces sp. ICN441]
MGAVEQCHPRPESPVVRTCGRGLHPRSQEWSPLPPLVRQSAANRVVACCRAGHFVLRTLCLVSRRPLGTRWGHKDRNRPTKARAY